MKLGLKCNLMHDVNTFRWAAARLGFAAKEYFCTSQYQWLGRGCWQRSHHQGQFFYSPYSSCADEDANDRDPTATALEPTVMTSAWHPPSRPQATMGSVYASGIGAGHWREKAGGSPHTNPLQGVVMILGVEHGCRLVPLDKTIRQRTSLG
jgi:hypothetical protein